MVQDDLPPSQSRLIAAFADHLRLERHLSPHTVSAYRHDLGTLATFLARDGSSLEAADHRLLRRFLAQQHTLGYARASVARRVGAIRTFYRWAVAEGLIDPDPSLLLGRPKVVNRLPTVLRAAEAVVLVEAPGTPGADDPIGRAVSQRDRAVLELLYGSGIRVGEAAGLRVQDVDLARGRVMVLGKGSKEREVPMSDDAVARVAEWLREGRPALASEGSPGPVLQPEGQTARPPRYPRACGRIWGTFPAGASGHAAYAAALVRDAPAGRGSRHPRGTGALGTRQRGDHAAVHPRLARPSVRGLRALPPEGLIVATTKKAPARLATKPAAKAPTKVAAKTRSRGATKPAAKDGAVTTIPPHVDDELGLVWHAFKGGREPEAREKLILHYAPLVKYVASRVATGLPASVEQADLVSYGMFGLIDALEKFEPGRGNKFETYAIPRIKGAIIDELRAMDWVPRSVRFKQREIEKALADLESMLKRQPTEKELAERLGVSLSELHEVIAQISFVSVLALDETVNVGQDRGERVSLVDTLADKGLRSGFGRRVAGDPWAAGGRDQLAVRAGEDRGHALLLRRAHAGGDR